MFDRLRKDTFLENNFIFFIGWMVVAVLNYLYHPVLGRMMSVEAFGEVQTLISLSTQLSIVGGVFGTIVVNLTANGNKYASIISRLYHLSLWLTVVLCVGLVLFSRQLEQALQFDSFYPFLSLAVILLIGVPFTFQTSFLQGVHDFKAVSWSGIIISAGRLLFAMLLVMLGWAAQGAIFGIVIANALALWYVWLKTRGRFRLTRTQDAGAPVTITQELKYGGLVFFTTGFVTFLYSADVLVVKYFFDPEQAGLYSGIATIARIILFATGSVAGVLLPSIRIGQDYLTNRRVLLKSLGLILAIGGGTLLLFEIAPELVVRLLIGSRYDILASLLPRLSLVLFIVAIINLLTIYFLALRRFFLIGVSVMGVLVVLGLCWVWHNTLLQVVNSFLIGSILTLVILVFWYIRDFYTLDAAANRITT